MNNYFQLSKEQQQMVFTQTANKTGLPVQAVEKDLWVTAVLQMVNPEKPDVPLNKNDAFQKVQKRRVQEKR